VCASKRFGIGANGNFESERQHRLASAREVLRASPATTTRRRAKMATRKSTGRKASDERAGDDDEKEEGTAPQAGTGDNDAIEMLTEDHQRVSDMFEEYESVKDDEEDGDKIQRVQEICLELTIHATVEEEIFYPAARDALGDEGEDLLNEAEVEHGSVKDLIVQLSESQPEDELYDAKVKVLSENVKHHVDEEEGELFPKLRDSDEFDVAAIGDQIAQRKQELREEFEEQLTS
jgi:hemerythrin superfamily protein